MKGLWQDHEPLRNPNPESGRAWGFNEVTKGGASALNNPAEAAAFAAEVVDGWIRRFGLTQACFLVSDYRSLLEGIVVDTSVVRSWGLER